MRKSLLSAAAAAALFIGVGAVHAQVLMYSFETGDSPNGKDGFLNNGSVPTQSTTGATVGSDALQVVTGSGFVGTYTQSDLPPVLSNPNLVGFTMDVTISANDTPFTGTFNDLGVSLFVSNAGEGEFGDSYAPPTSSFANVDLAPGTYNLAIPLTGNNPDTGIPTSFGTLLSEGWTVSGFELANSDNGVETFYVDNIQGVVPEPASISLIGIAGAALLGRRRRKI